MTGELQRFGPIHLSPSSGVLNYGQGVFEGMKAYRKVDGSILLFRPEENALRMRMGAERMCMPAPTVEHFVDAVKQTVLANKRWVPPPGKGSLYIRPMLLGTGPVLGVAPALEYTFLIFVSPVGNYFKEGLAPLNLIIDTETHRAIPGGTGGVKAIGNYSPVDKMVEIQQGLELALRIWNSEFVKNKNFQGEYKRWYESGVETITSLESQLTQCNTTIATSLSLQLQDLQKLVGGWWKHEPAFVKGSRALQRRTEIIIEGLTPSQALKDSSSDSDGDDIESELKKLLFNDDEGAEENVDID
ncbi:branched-chain-amino-acid aminotransferase 5, chloroplastic-like [Phalaenopsis equestris]|uniref:branched-chain-amino-acid aminotransferase 5, chloroplastic-like n=1 Tax=Phalaenopsis equestris TaxID=78828 RepID=UPI0009E2DCB7|nr:branched-chain-amino-acid aminotransferase 5, chloroplastic-like [Phalaenopsis equestris]